MPPRRDWTVGVLIKWAAEYLSQKKCDSPRLDGELLLAHSLSIRRLDLYLEYNKPLNPEELAGFKALILRRAKGEPVAYIIGCKGFHKLNLKVCPATLIPRPETELLVEAALDRLEENSSACVLELGTGAGGVILSLSLERKDIAPSATDISPEALEQARANAVDTGLDGRVEFLEGDLFAPLDGRSYKMILMNPPYVTEAEYERLATDITCFEPARALLAGSDGLNVIRRLVREAPAYLEEGGCLLFEIGSGQGEAASALLADGPYKGVKVLKDLAGLDRVVVGRKG